MRGDKPDPRDDVYALGVIWYQFLMGDLTSPAPTGRRWIDVLRGRGMSDPALDLLSSCFEGDPAYRPADAGMLAERLQALSTSASSATTAAAVEVPAMEAGISPYPEAFAPPPKTGRKPDWAPDPSSPSRGGTNKTGDRHLGGSEEVTVLPGSRAESPAPSASRATIRAKPAPATRPDRGVDDARMQPESQLPLGPTKRSWRWVAAGALGFFGLLGVILYVATDHGTVKITGTDPQMKVLIDGREIRIENVGQPITIRTGTHSLVVTRGDLVVTTQAFQVQRGQKTPLEVAYTPKTTPPVTHGGPEPAPSPARPEPRPPGPILATAGEPKPALLRPNREWTNSIGMKLVLIPAGEFLMGSPDEDKDAFAEEKPRHRVKITRPFYLGVHEVTQDQYRAVMGQNPSDFKGSDDLPVEQVSWLDAVTFCNALSEREQRTPFYRIDGTEVTAVGGNGYRLPSEAEWEYACRAGSTTSHPFGDDARDLGEHAWYTENSGSKTHPVGRKRPNAWGLYDTLGNVWEWCSDGYDGDFYKQSPIDDPAGPSRATDRVIRGGSWATGPRLLRSAFRYRYVPGYRDFILGFRVARVQ
jgi:formylglycine-generating enzyme required for sulfatase activity